MAINTLHYNIKSEDIIDFEKLCTGEQKLIVVPCYLGNKGQVIYISNGKTKNKFISLGTSCKKVGSITSEEASLLGLKFGVSPWPLASSTPRHAFLTLWKERGGNVNALSYFTKLKCCYPKEKKMLPRIVVTEDPMVCLRDIPKGHWGYNINSVSFVLSLGDDNFININGESFFADENMDAEAKVWRDLGKPQITSSGLCVNTNDVLKTKKYIDIDIGHIFRRPNDDQLFIKTNKGVLLDNGIVSSNYQNFDGEFIDCGPLPDSVSYE